MPLAAAVIHVADWGRLPDGGRAQLATLKDLSGLDVRLTNYGATLTSIRTPDSNGQLADILLGYESLNAYLEPQLQAAWPYLGSTIGRYANRIAGGRFRIDGVEVLLDRNEGVNQNHGGPSGFDRKLWSMRPLPKEDGVRLTYTSPDGEGGFPGKLEASADFLLGAPGELIIRYSATSDAATHVNLASHGYFNLSGRSFRSIGDHRLTIAASRFVPIDGAALPCGAPIPVAGTPFDLRAGRRLSEIFGEDHAQLQAGDGLNHCYVLDERAAVAARLDNEASGRYLEISTTEPGLQVYSANGFDETIKDGDGRPYLRRQAVALEAQHFPDSPNRPDFPSTLLRPGETYRTETRFRFGVASRVLG